MRSADSIARRLGDLSRRWLDKNYSYRKKALKRLVEKSRFTRDAAVTLLDSLFSELTTPKLRGLLKAEFKDPRVLDGFRRDPRTRTRHRARGPRVITHIFSGNVPNPSIVSFILGMLAKSVNIGKVSSRDAGILDIYLESLRAVDKGLSKTNRLIKPSDRKSLGKAIAVSDLVVAYGDDRTLEAIRKQVPVKSQFCGYGQRVSFGIYLKEALTQANAPSLAKKTARDIRMMDQRGCLSPTTITLERGGEVSPLQFSRAAAGLLTKERWLTLHEEGTGRFPLSASGKVIYFKAFRKIDEVYSSVKPFSKYLQSVALEGSQDRRLKIAEKLSELGVNRLCRAGQMQRPPITWHHDGMPNLASWVRWTDLED